MICPLCHEQHPDNAQFCPRTGEQIVFACPNCDNQVRVGSKFCTYCGMNFSSQHHGGITAAIPPKETRWSPLLIILLSVGGIIVIGIVVLILNPSLLNGFPIFSQSATTPTFTPEPVALLPAPTLDVIASATEMLIIEATEIQPTNPPSLTPLSISTATQIPSTLTPLPTEIAAPDLDDLLIAFNSNRTGNNEIFIMNAKGKKIEQLTNNPYDDRVPSWSPKGDKIAFQSNRDGDYEIYVLDLSSGSLQQITSSECNDYAPAWSPDGEKFAYYSECDGNREIFIINANGSNRKQLTTTNDVYNWFPTWSPDGETITFSSNRSGNYMVYLMNRDGSNVQDLVRGCVSSFSPDGRKILFSSYCTDDGDIYQMNSDGTNVQTVLADYESRNPSWSPDGKSVVFQSNLSGNYDIWSLDLISMGLIRLTDHTAEDSAPVWQISSK